MLTTEQLAKFREDGYLIVENFINEETINKLKQEIQNIIQTGEFYEELKNLAPEHRTSKSSHDYFMESANKIRGFLEFKANEIKEGDTRSDLIFSLIGFGLHALNPVFRDATYNDATNTILRQLDFQKPVACQSIYIFKSPNLGREWRPHQDAAYLYTEPVIKLLGIWIALDDATVENGCLEFVPGSHKNGILSRRFIRNSNKEEWDAGKRVFYVGDELEYNDNEFVPAPVKAGGLVLIDGLVVHRSRENVSSKSRQAYTYHVYDSGVSSYSSENWGQENPISFVPFYNDTQNEY